MAIAESPVNRKAPNPMRGFFLTHYATLADAAGDMGLSHQALGAWMIKRPEQIYKHLELWHAKGVTAERLMEVVKEQRAYIAELD
jgi:hypothetical protein